MWGKWTPFTKRENTFLFVLSTYPIYSGQVVTFCKNIDQPFIFLQIIHPFVHNWRNITETRENNTFGNLFNIFVIQKGYIYDIHKRENNNLDNVTSCFDVKERETKTMQIHSYYGYMWGMISLEMSKIVDSYHLSMQCWNKNKPYPPFCAEYVVLLNNHWKAQALFISTSSRYVNVITWRRIIFPFNFNILW